MLKALRRLFTGPTNVPDLARPALAEPLERRTHLDTTAPTLVHEQLIGNDPRRVEGVVLTFSEPLDEVSAETLEHYRVGVRTSRKQVYDDDDFNDSNNNRGLIRFESAVYDPATNSVTLTAVEPFNITRRFRAIRVLGRQELGVRDVAGNILDGDENGVAGGDAVEKYTFSRGNRVTYGELDGDNVTLTLRDPGRIWVVRETQGGRVVARGDARKVFIDDADPAKSILTGKVSGRGNGVAVIDELAGTSFAQVPIAADPAFTIVRSIP